MAIKPIDMQVVIPNTTKISNEKQGQQNKSVSINQNNTQQIKDKYEHDVEYVHHKDNAEQASIQKKQREEDNNKEHRDQKKNDNEEQQEKEPDKQKNKDGSQLLGSNFDIKV